MSDAPAPARPRQVSLAAGTTIAASVLVVLMAFEQVAGLRSLETQEALARTVAEPPVRDLGVTVDQVAAVMRVLTMTAAACAVAAAILAWHVLRRNAAARVALTVVAVPLFLAGLATGALASSVAAAAVVSLWFRPARAWFAGEEPAEPDAGSGASGRGTSTATAAPPVPPDPGGRPGPYAGSYGATAVGASPRRGTATATVMATAPATTPPPGAAGAGHRRRPAAVTLACVITWVASGLTALLMVGSGLLLAADPGYLLARARQQNPELTARGVTDDVLIAVTLVMVTAIVLWCLAAAVLGVLVLRGVGWARILLVVSAASTAALSLVGTALGAFLLVLTLGASVATVALLVRSDVRSFFARR